MVRRQRAEAARASRAYAVHMSDAARRREGDLTPDERAQLEAAHRELQAAVDGYQSFLGGELAPGANVKVHDARDMAEAQSQVAVAEDRLWKVREELLGWARPAWAPSAALVSDWFSEEDAVYDDLPETAAS